MQLKILIIDDDDAVGASLSILFKRYNYLPLIAVNPEQAQAVLNDQSVDLAILDMNFSNEISGNEGLELLSRIRESYPHFPVILLTAWGTIDLAVQGMKLGAADFLTKPWDNDHLMQSVQTALNLAKSKHALHQPSKSRQQLEKKLHIEKLIGEDSNFLSALETVGRVSLTDAPVLITGESGTGKELIAEAIHLNSHRHNNPFIKVNLGGISSSLFESEMFGHIKGAFTDARYDRIGRFEMAHTGTIFLDEIGDLDLSSQVKLLRVLQDRTFEMLGSSEPKKIDFRLICATNRDLAKLVAAQNFREDLFYRINLITIHLPALRERKDDIPILANHFVNNLKTIYGREKLQISRKALNWLRELQIPGNIRELKNLVERTVLISAKDILETDDFIAHLQDRPPSGKKETLPAVGAMTLEEMEKSMITKAFEYHNKNISQVARSLGLSRAALYRRMEKYGISE